MPTAAATAVSQDTAQTPQTVFRLTQDNQNYHISFVLDDLSSGRLGAPSTFKASILP